VEEKVWGRERDGYSLKRMFVVGLPGVLGGSLRLVAALNKNVH